MGALMGAVHSAMRRNARSGNGSGSSDMQMEERGQLGSDLYASNNGGTSRNT